MDEQKLMQLQAFLDGELPEKEAREVAALVAKDQEAAALLQELRFTRQALAGYESEIKLPETREFYWSKIEREIRRLEESPAPAPAPTPLSFLARLNRILLPLGGVAVVAALILLAAGHHQSTAREIPAGEIELASQDMAAVAYRSHKDGVTLVWLYDRDNDSSQFTDEPSWNKVEIE